MRQNSQKANEIIREKLKLYSITNPVVVSNLINYQERAFPYRGTDDICLLPSSTLDGLARVLEEKLEEELKEGIFHINEGIKDDKVLARFFDCLGFVDIHSRSCSLAERERLYIICHKHLSENPYRMSGLKKEAVWREMDEIYFHNISVK